MSEQTPNESSKAGPTQTGGLVAASSPAKAEPGNHSTRFMIIVLAVVFVIAVLIVLAVYFLYTHPGSTAVIRDIFIIAMAFTSMLIGLFMVVLIIQLQALISLLRNEIKPMLNNANQTVSTVRGTAVFVSDNLVRPTISIASFIAGVKGAQQAVMGRMNKPTNHSGVATPK